MAEVPPPLLKEIVAALEVKFYNQDRRFDSQDRRLNAHERLINAQQKQTTQNTEKLENVETELKNAEKENKEFGNFETTSVFSRKLKIKYPSVSPKTKTFIFPKNCNPILMEFLNVQDFWKLRSAFRKSGQFIFENFPTFPHIIRMIQYSREHLNSMSQQFCNLCRITYQQNQDNLDTQNKVNFNSYHGSTLVSSGTLSALKDCFKCDFKSFENGLNSDLYKNMEILDCGGLTHLEVSGSNGKLYRRIFDENTGSLTHLEISGGVNFIDDEITLPELQNICFSQIDVLPSINWLWCPKIINLELKNHQKNDNALDVSVSNWTVSILDNLNRFIRKHGHLIQEMTIPINWLDTLNNKIDFFRFTNLKKLIATHSQHFHFANYSQTHLFGGNQDGPDLLRKTLKVLGVVDVDVYGRMSMVTSEYEKLPSEFTIRGNLRSNLVVLYGNSSSRSFQKSDVKTMIEQNFKNLSELQFTNLKNSRNQNPRIIGNKENVVFL